MKITKIMGKFYILTLFLFLSHASMQTEAQPLCFSHFASAYQACSFNWPSGPREVESKSGSQPKHEVVPLSRDHDHRRGDPEDSACCRWLSIIDNACMCQVLARLPLFMSRLNHDLKLSPEDGCEVEFQCGGH